MASFARRWAGTLAATVLLVIAGTVSAQGWNTGSIHGKLTDSRSRPLKQTMVILRNERSGVESRIVTARNGEYHFVGLPPGHYSLEATSASLGHGSIDGIAVGSGSVSMQIALDFDGNIVSGATAGGVTSAATTPDPDFMQIRGVEEDRRAMDAAVVPTEGASAKRPTPVTPVKIAGATNQLHDDEAVISELETVTAVTPLGSSGLSPIIGGIDLAAKLAGAARQSALRALTTTAIKQAAFQIALSQAQKLQNSVLSTESATSGSTTTITGEELQALPLTGRHWENFADDRPPPAAQGNEVTEDAASDPGGVRGVVTTVDGVGMALAFGAKAKPMKRGSALLGLGRNEAAIAKIRLASPESSFEGGGTANSRATIETRQGSRELHGQSMVLTRRNLWGAQNPFSTWLKESSTATADSVPAFTAVPYTPADRDLTLGVGIGGSIHSDRLFWFAALDKDGRNFPGVSTVKHPDNFFAQPVNDQMQVLSARLGLSGADPAQEATAAYSTMLETLGGLLGPAPRSSNEWLGFTRIDGKVAERHHFTVEGTMGSWDSPGGGLTRTSESYGNHSFGSTKAKESQVMGRWEAYVTPNLLTVAQGSVGRQVFTEQPETPSTFENSLDVNAWQQLPQIVVDSRYGFTIGNPARFGAGNYPDENMYEGQEGVDWVKGTMLVRAGLTLSHNRDATSLVRNHTGTYSYASVENFVSDALAFGKFGLAGALDPLNLHNCDQTGKVWRDPSGQLNGLGYLPCYAYYSQTMGPTDWYLGTNDAAGYVTSQWQPGKQFVASASLRWQRELLPPPIDSMQNSSLPLTAKLPTLGNEWAPRVGLAWGKSESHLPVLRLGYGMYFGRTTNSVLETVLTHTGSLKGDLDFFLRPTDNLLGAGAPAFPYVFAGEPGSVVKPGAVEMSQAFQNAEVHQGVASMEETLPGHLTVNASAVVSLARHLPVTVDTNIDPSVNPGTITYEVIDGTGKGPIKAPQITVPFFASWPSSRTNGGRLKEDYRQISQIFSRANSTYEELMLRLSRPARHGLSIYAHYSYAHAMDWNPNEGDQVAGSSVLDPTNFEQEYGTGSLDIRHRASGILIWRPPWNMHGAAGAIATGWTLSAIGQFSSGLPFTMRTAGTIPEEFGIGGTAIVGLGPSMNGYGGDNRIYGVGRNTYRYPATWKADLRLGRNFILAHDRELDLLGESFNLFNHENVTELETTGYSIEPGDLSGSLPTLRFLTGLKTGQTEFGMPLNINATDFYRARQIDFGMRLRF